MWFISWSTGLQRCGKSCRLRWINYLRPDIRRGRFTPEEEKLIISLPGVVGNRFNFNLTLAIINPLIQHLFFYLFALLTFSVQMSYICMAFINPVVAAKNSIST